MILAIDTTGQRGSIALGDKVREIEAPTGFGNVVFAEIEALLRENGVTLGDIQLFAAAAGPGTFTGLRIGLACAKGLAEAMGKPVCAVSNLEALAEFGTGEERAVQIDARRGDVYAAKYGLGGRVIMPEQLLRAESFQPNVHYDGPLAGAVAAIAARRWAAGMVEDAMTVDANYIRRSDAELHLSLS